MTTTAQQLSNREWQTYNAEETFNLGKQIGAQLSGGEILLLHGPLGAGKTIFVKGVAAALDIDPEEVTSPSFTLVNPMEGRLPISTSIFIAWMKGPLPLTLLIWRNC